MGSRQGLGNRGSGPVWPTTETGEYVKALGPKIEELDKACAQVRQILYGLRKVLKP